MRPLPPAAVSWTIVIGLVISLGLAAISEDAANAFGVVFGLVLVGIGISWLAPVAEGGRPSRVWAAVLIVVGAAGVILNLFRLT